MSKVGKWSTTAGNNQSAPPDGWPEGQDSNTVNDCAREMMAQIAILARSIEYIDLDNTPTYLTANSFSLGTADTTNWHVGRRIKAFDTTTLYGTIASVSGTTVIARLDSGIFSSSLSSIALAALSNASPSLPNAAYQAQNVIINGAFDIWQRTASVGAVVGGTLAYVADRFYYNGNTAATCNVYRSERSATSTNVPSLLSAGVLLNNSLTIQVQAADAAMAAGEWGLVEYVVEGYDFRPIAHQPLGLSFQVNSNRSGIYAVAIRNGARSASFVQNYTISAINTWQRVFVPIPEAPPTPYSWNYSNSAGLLVTFTLAAGASFQSTGGEWTAMNSICTPSQVNFLASAGNVISFANVALKLGNADTPVAYRHYTDELLKCQRY